MADRSHRVSRLSVRPGKYRPRDSVFVGNAETYRGDTQAVCSPFLRECVLAMEDCCDEAYEAQEIIRQGTYDLPRMTKVLENERVFLLIDEATVRRYKADLTDEIEPQINELISRAEKGLKVLLRRESTLLNKIEATQSRPPSRAVATAAGTNKLDARRILMTVKQRELLEEELAALQKEVVEMEITQAMKQGSALRVKNKPHSG
ncbi:Spc19-domain-containing protein [Amylocystis lapponica]|nr:Spc19-domain-containing protein [Amylocystis lapponica]